MKSTVRIASAFFSILLSSASIAQTDEPYIYILGVARDAGYPQIGCYTEHCLGVWIDPSLRGGATSIAGIISDSGRKYPFETTPNLPAQLYTAKPRSTQRTIG